MTHSNIAVLNKDLQLDCKGSKTARGNNQNVTGIRPSIIELKKQRFDKMRNTTSQQNDMKIFNSFETEVGGKLTSVGSLDSQKKYYQEGR